MEAEYRSSAETAALALVQKSLDDFSEGLLANRLHFAFCGAINHYQIHSERIGSKIVGPAWIRDKSNQRSELLLFRLPPSYFDHPRSMILRQGNMLVPGESHSHVQTALLAVIYKGVQAQCSEASRNPASLKQDA